MIRFTFDIVSPKMTQPMVRNPLLVVLMLTVLEIGNPSSGNYHLTQASFLEVRIRRPDGYNVSLRSIF